MRLRDLKPFHLYSYKGVWSVFDIYQNQPVLIAKGPHIGIWPNDHYTLIITEEIAAELEPWEEEMPMAMWNVPTVEPKSDDNKPSAKETALQYGMALFNNKPITDTKEYVKLCDEIYQWLIKE